MSRVTSKVVLPRRREPRLGPRLRGETPGPGAPPSPRHPDESQDPDPGKPEPDPNTGWLGDCVALDDKAFVLTGPAALPPDWPLERAPHFLETSRPGIFAVGDVRSGSVKRVAAAVGEGAAAVQSLHSFLGA